MKQQDNDSAQHSPAHSTLIEHQPVDSKQHLSWLRMLVKLTLLLTTVVLSLWILAHLNLWPSI